METSDAVTIVVTVPETHAQIIRDAMGRAGAGKVGNYSYCSYSVKGIGRFIPNIGSDPFIGKEGVMEEVVEERIETVIDIYPVYKIGRKKSHGGVGKESSPSLSPIANSIIVGSLYEHYKGHRYKVVGVARHSETLEEMVVYQALYREGGIWVRPMEMFLENVVINGHPQPRFKLVE